jgi:2-oxoglutarate ferredoxin oxidoreductase subunit alpha
MHIDLTVTIGGSAGQGIQTVGELLAGVCHKAGLYLMAINDFESRIRGGLSFMQLRISDEPVEAPDDSIHLLVALNDNSYRRLSGEVAEDGRILLEENPDQGGPAAGNILEVPFTRLAKEAGGSILANTVAAGAVLGMLGAPAGLLDEFLSVRFAGKSREVLENNRNAARAGRDAVAEAGFARRFRWPGRPPAGKLISGARALALASLAADCRLAAFYPMSPATNIMVNMVGFMEEFPLVVEQAEDEIAAVNMAIGASFAGVRAMTATSGGGFSLMVEGLGLAAMTETPLVVINGQRPGPATGLPSRTAQADLRFVIHASQDEFPRFVLAPRNPDEGFSDMLRAFHLAEKYQVPVIVLVDQYFTDSLFIAQGAWTAPETIERFIAADADIAEPENFKRFALTDSGVSPRAIPCRGRARVMVTGNEHQEDGHLSEAVLDRNSQFEKRKAKLSGMIEEMKGPDVAHAESRLLLVAWGSTDGVVREAMERLRKDGHDVGLASFADLWPFPAKEAKKALSGCGRFATVELNGSGQLAGLFREHTGLVPAHTIARYDGRPMQPGWVVKKAKELLEESR